MKPSKDAFIVLAPTGKSKTFSIALRRIGSRERYTVVASCQSDTTAQRIVDGLLLLQGEEVKLDIPAQRVLAEVREQLIRERTKADLDALKRREEARVQEAKIRDLDLRLGDSGRKVRDLERQVAELTAKQTQPAE